MNDPCPCCFGYHSDDVACMDHERERLARDWLAALSAYDAERDAWDAVKVLIARGWVPPDDVMKDEAPR